MKKYKEIKEIKKSQKGILEMKNTITKIKNSLDELNSRMQMTEESVNLKQINRNYLISTTERA